MRQEWKINEIEKLKDLNGERYTKEEIIKMFHNRTYESIIKKARTLNVKWKIKMVSERVWSDDEISILKEKYDSPEIYELISRSKSAIQNKINELGFSIRNKRWKKDEIKYLTKNYYSEDKVILEKNLNRSWSSIKIKAQYLNLVRSFDFVRKSNMSKLLDGSNQSFYWLGFLLADGHFNIKSKRIDIGLSMLDFEHLKMFAKFLETPNIVCNILKNNCRLTVQNTEIFDDVIDLIGVYDSNKTENPTYFNKYNFTKEQMISLIIGFIDGDGNISKQTNRDDCFLRIKLHKTWLNNLIFIENFIFNYFHIEKNKEQYSNINKQGYANLTFSNNKIIKGLKGETKRLKLNVLDRKWDKIN